MGSMPAHHGAKRKQQKASSFPFSVAVNIWGIGTCYVHCQEGTGWQGRLASFCWEKRKKKSFLSKSHITVCQWLGKTGGHSSIQGHWGGLERAGEGTVTCGAWSVFVFSFKRSLLLLARVCFAQVGLLPYFQDQLLCGAKSRSSTTLLVIRGVRAVSAGQSVPGLFSARTLLIPAQLQCMTYPKNWWAISQNSINPKTFSYFIGYELWIPTHYFPVEICHWVVLLWLLYFILYTQVRHNHCKMKPCHCLPVFNVAQRKRTAGWGNIRIFPLRFY